jgi:predicted acyl esterase
MTKRLFCLVAVLVVGSSGLGVPSAAPKDKEGLSKPIYMESVIETARVPMRDGETLFVEIRRPVVPAGVRVPVILTLSPYNDLTSPFPPEILGLTQHPLESTPFFGDTLAKFFVPRGYARAIADVRGTRESSGCWDYGGVLERHDGYDLVEWLGKRPWSNGKVAMIGASYEGTTANAAAVERPPHLATIVPIASIDRWYDYAYMNGVRWFLNSEEATDEGFDTPAGFDFGLAVPPPVDARAAEWSDAVVDRYRPCAQVEHTVHGYNPQPDYDQFWLDRDYRVRASNITIPVLVGHGLDDFNVKFTGGLEMYRRVRGPKRLVIGQWTHANPDETTIGTWENLLWRWFDKWLLGLETRVTSDPAVDVEDTAKKWHQETTWPPASAVARTLWLGGGGALSAVPGAAADESFVDVALVTEVDMIVGPSPGALLYMGEPVAKDTRIAGEPTVDLRMTSDSASTHIAVLLADVAPEGTYQRISRGFMNPRYRNGFDHGVDLEPGKECTVSFALSAADHIVAAGHRIAVAVSSSNLVWAVPDLQRASNTVHLGGAAGSRITLPIVGAAAVKGAKVTRPAVKPSKPSAKPRRLPATGVGRTWWALAMLAAAVGLGFASRKAAS